MASETYLGNPNLKNVGQKIEWTEESLTEYMKCKESPEYFIANFVKIIHVDHGLVPFEMYDYQKDMINKFNDNRFVICKMPRQTGKSTTMLFSPTKARWQENFFQGYNSHMNIYLNGYSKVRLYGTKETLK